MKHYKPNNNGQIYYKQKQKTNADSGNNLMKQ